MEDCPKCNGTMEYKGIIQETESDYGPICLYQCTECKNVEIN